MMPQADDNPRSVLLVLLDGDLVQTPEHLGVSYLASVLRRDGFECVLMDVPPGEDERAVEAVSALRPRFIGVSLTTVNFPRASRLGHALRATLGPETHICAGGPVATFMGARLLQLSEWSFLDSFVRGEAEGVIAQLVGAVVRGESPRELPGVNVRGESSAARPVVAVDDLDELPWPARDQLEARGGRLPYVRLSTSRGCTSQCTFCNAPHAGNNLAHSKVWRGRSPEDVVEEIAFLQSKYGSDTFDFVDSTFEDPGEKVGKQRVRRIAELILERGLRIYYNICAQAKNWTERDLDLLDLLYRSGLEKVLIGIESGSDRSLKLFKKLSTAADNLRTIELFRRRGVYVAFGFIMFHPHSDWEDVEDNADFLLRSLGHNLRRFVTRLELYPGAEVVAELARDGLLRADYWQTLNPYAYRYVNEGVGWLARMLNEMFGEEYAAAGSLREEPSVFAFETFDITLHTYLSRLERAHGDNARAREVIDQHLALLDAEKASLAAFNGDFFADALRRAKAGDGLQSGAAERVEERYSAAMDKIRGIQLRFGMNLRRSGVEPHPFRSVARG